MKNSSCSTGKFVAFLLLFSVGQDSLADDNEDSVHDVSTGSQAVTMQPPKEATPVEDATTDVATDLSESFFTLGNGARVPVVLPDGRRGTKTLGGLGGGVYYKGLHITKDGAIRRYGKVIAELQPGQLITGSELSRITDIKGAAPEASSTAERPAVGASDLPSTPTDVGDARPGAGSTNGIGNEVVQGIGSYGANQNGINETAKDDKSFNNARSAGITAGLDKVGPDSSVGSGGTGGPLAYEDRSADGRDVFVLANGRAVPRAAPDGAIGKPNQNGGVDYAGGESINPTADGRTVVTGQKTGNYIVVENSEDENGNATFDLGNGTSVPAQESGVGQGHISASGNGVEYEDGTFVSVDSKTGNTVFMHPDGSSEVIEGQDRKAAANYVYHASGGATGGNSPNDSGEKKDFGDNSGSNSSDSSSDDNSSDDDSGDDDDGGDDGGDDSDDGSEGGGDDGGEEGEDDSGEGGADENVGVVGEGGNDPEAKATVDNALARKRGDGKEPEAVAPPTCDEGGMSGPGGVMKPTGDEQGCVPAGIAPGGQDDEEEEAEPILGNPGDDFKRDGENNLQRVPGLVGQPGLDEEQISNDGRTLEDKLQDIEDVVNPDDR